MSGQHPAVDILFQTLFRNEYDRLCRYALTYMQDSQLAEDVVQDTFIKIWEQKKELIVTPNIRFYLITAVRNNCISALRRQKVQQVYYMEETPEPEPEPFPHFREQEEERNMQRRKIVKALNLLPPKCREVFLLVKLQGMSYKQTATILNLSVKTVENQMGKALRIFRETTLGTLLPLICQHIINTYF